MRLRKIKLDSTKKKEGLLSLRVGFESYVKSDNGRDVLPLQKTCRREP